MFVHPSLCCQMSITVLTVIRCSSIYELSKSIMSPSQQLRALRHLQKSPHKLQGRILGSLASPLVAVISGHRHDACAIIHSDSDKGFTYGRLCQDIANAKVRLRQDLFQGRTPEGQRLAFMLDNGYDYVGAPSINHRTGPWRSICSKLMSL